MTAIAFAFAAVTFLLWLIEHVGGREQRDDLRDQLRGMWLGDES